jgi:hypothetical protein
MANVLKALILDLWPVPQFLVSAYDHDVTYLPQSHGSPSTGDYNFRVDRFDCGTDPYGYYEDDV